MHASANPTALTLLAAAALGAAALGGCSSSADGPKKKPALPDDPIVLEPTNPGGQRPPSESAGPTCESGQDADFISPKCQACLASKCCDELQGCFDLPGGDGEQSDDCTAYATCIDDCGLERSTATREACYGGCDDRAAKGVARAYSDIEACAIGSCKAACAGQ